MAGFILAYGRSQWRWIPVVVIAFLPLFALPGSWILDQSRAVASGMFILIGALAGIVLGMGLRRRKEG